MNGCLQGPIDCVLFVVSSKNDYIHGFRGWSENAELHAIDPRFSSQHKAL